MATHTHKQHTALQFENNLMSISQSKYYQRAVTRGGYSRKISECSKSSETAEKDSGYNGVFHEAESGRRGTAADSNKTNRALLGNLNLQGNETTA